MTTATATRPRKFDDCDELVRLIFEAVGAASVAWKTEAGNEVFDEREAVAIADEVIERIRAGINDGPNWIGPVLQS